MSYVFRKLMSCSLFFLDLLVMMLRYVCLSIHHNFTIVMAVGKRASKCLFTSPADGNPNQPSLQNNNWPMTDAVRLQLYRMASSPNTSPELKVRRPRPAWVTFSSPSRIKMEFRLINSLFHILFQTEQCWNRRLLKCHEIHYSMNWLWGTFCCMFTLMNVSFLF